MSNSAEYWYGNDPGGYVNDAAEKVSRFITAKTGVKAVSGPTPTSSTSAATGRVAATAGPQSTQRQRPTPDFTSGLGKTPLKSQSNHGAAQSI